MAQSIGLLDHFSALKDPREQWRVLYPLREVLLLLLCGTLSGMDDFVEINLWGRERLDFLRRFLPFEHGVPSHDTLNDIVNAMDGKVFQDCFTSWVETLRDSSPDIVAIDGKTSRRTHARSKGREPLHLVSAWASRQRLVLGQEAVTDKSNEIVAIPLLLKRLELKGALVTIDAIGTQVEIAKIIVNGGGDYLLALKDNWPAFRAEVETFFADDTNATAFQTFDTTDADHGRLEQRHHVVCQEVDWLLSERRFPKERPFPRMAMIAMVQTATERAGKVEREKRYYISSAKLDANLFANAVRAHWGIENRLHWVLDVVFHDDLARLRTGFGPQNMAVVKHIAMNLIRHPNDRHSLKNRRKLACLNSDYLEAILRAPAALT
ncbi:MAG TPA: ISAs1 family transposase [Roseimicrobium sp.]|jgi:predicted transposase YbfD/YdcC|nr:ISAs1 family transposase [Roseimicrobium sp.]